MSKKEKRKVDKKFVVEKSDFKNLVKIGAAVILLMIALWIFIMTSFVGK